MKHLIPKQIIEHPFEYLSLALFFGGAVFAFFFFTYDAHSQRRVVYFTSAGYLLWSLYHHYRRGDLHLSIFIEYLVLAALAIVVALFTLV